MEKVEKEVVLTTKDPLKNFVLQFQQKIKWSNLTSRNKSHKWRSSISQSSSWFETYFMNRESITELINRNMIRSAMKVFCQFTLLKKHFCNFDKQLYPIFCFCMIGSVNWLIIISVHNRSSKMFWWNYLGHCRYKIYPPILPKSLFCERIVVDQGQSHREITR